MSAGTMLACAANRIVLGKHSFLGPIDPQFILQGELGNRIVPAHAIIDQFKLAKEECKNTQNLGPWLPILKQYGPALLIECRNAIDLSRILVRDWLSSFMLNGQKRASYKASLIARKLGAHKDHKTHGRHLDRDRLRKLGLDIDDLEKDQKMQDLVLSVFHAATITMMITPCAKIIENQNGKAFIKHAGFKVVKQQKNPPPVLGTGKEQRPSTPLEFAKES